MKLLAKSSDFNLHELCNFSRLKFGTQKLGSLSNKIWSQRLFSKKSHGKRLFSTNQMTENSKNVSFLTKKHAQSKN